MSIYGPNQPDWTQPDKPPQPTMTAEERQKHVETIAKSGVMLGCLVTAFFLFVAPIILVIIIGIWGFLFGG